MEKIGFCSKETHPEDAASCLRRFRAAKRRVCGVDRKRKVFCSGLPKEILKTASIRPLSGRSKSIAKTVSQKGLEISEFGFPRKTTEKWFEPFRAFLIGNTPRLPHRSKEEGFLHTLAERNFENGADGAAFWAAKVRCRNFREICGNSLAFRGKPGPKTRLAIWTVSSRMNAAFAP